MLNRKTTSLHAFRNCYVRIFSSFINDVDKGVELEYEQEVEE